MPNRLLLAMVGIAMGAGVIVWLLLRQEPGRVETRMTPPTPAPVAAPTPAPPPATAVAAKPTPTTAPPSATHPEQPVPDAPRPAPLPPGTTLREGHATGPQVAPVKMEKMPLEQKLEKAGQLASVLDNQAAAIEKEAADADAAGKSDEAARKRVLVKRLRARADELRNDVETKQEPQ